VLAEGHFQRMAAREQIEFLGIGAQKCGTTWLHQNLKAHPNLWLPEEKELHFFDKVSGQSLIDWGHNFQLKDAASVLSAARDHRIQLNFSHKPHRKADYLRMFEDAPQSKIVGEITPAYAMLHGQSIREIAGWFPDLKLIFNSKSPAVRAYGNALNRLQRRAQSVPLGSWKSYETDLLATLADAKNLGKSLFSQNLMNWLSFFPSSQLFILAAEDIAERPAMALADVASYLGADPAGFENATIEIASKPVHQSPISSSRSFDSHPPSSTVAKVLKEIYLPEISRLEALLNRDLSNWRDELLLL